LSSSAAETQENDKRRLGKGVKVLGLTLEGQTMLEKLTTKKWQDLLSLRIEQDFEECCAHFQIIEEICGLLSYVVWVPILLQPS